MNKNIRRIGRFRLDAKLIEEFNYDAIIGVMSNFIIIRCEHSYAGKCFHYTAISHLFDEVKEGAEHPEYVILITGEVGKQSVSVNKI